MLDAEIAPLLKNNFRGRNGDRDETRLIRLLLEEPTWSFRDYVESLKSQAPERRMRLSVRDTLGQWELDYTDNRVQWIREVREQADWLVLTLTQPAAADPTKIRAAEDEVGLGKWVPPSYKAILMLTGEALSKSVSEAFKNEWNDWLYRCDIGESKRLYTELIQVAERLQRQATTSLALNTVEMEVQDLRMSLEHAQRQLELVEREFSAEREELYSEAIIDFIQEMNSQPFGNILDRVSDAETILRRLGKEGYEFPQELDGLRILPRLLFKFFKKQHITTIAEVGVQRELNLDDSIEFDYRGTDFSARAETKNVVIETPGWRLKNRLISLPAVREVQEEPQVALSKES